MTRTERGLGTHFARRAFAPFAVIELRYPERHDALDFRGEFVLVLVVGLGSALAADAPLVGVWQLDPGQVAQAGLYMFTPTHYSMVAAATDRADIADTNKATADELRAYWGPLLANAGTYEIAGDLLTIHPIAAKFPVVMKAWANEVYRFHVDGRALTLQQVRNARGVTVTQAAILKFTRLE